MQIQAVVDEAKRLKALGKKIAIATSNGPQLVEGLLDFYDLNIFDAMVFASFNFVQCYQFYVF